MFTPNSRLDFGSLEAEGAFVYHSSRRTEAAKLSRRSFDLEIVLKQTH